MAFTSSTNFIREVKNLSPNFKRIFGQVDPFYRKALINSATNHVQIAYAQLIHFTSPYN